MFSKYPKLFVDPHIHYPNDNLDLSFPLYIEQCKTLIKEHRLDLNEQADLIIEANAPFELQPTAATKNTSKIKYGALLVHGLFDSPFLMRDVGRSLQAEGLLVRAILLPGHGTVPGSLLNVKYEDWVQTIRYGVASLEKDVEQIFLVGFSTGGILSLQHALLNPANIAGIILLSPAFKIHSFFDFATDWHRVMSWAWPRAQWMSIGPERDYTKYYSATYNAGHQVYRLTKDVKKLTQTLKLKPPLFIALSYEDKIVTSSVAIQYFLTLTHPNNAMIVYSNKNLSYSDNRILVRNSAYPKWHIVNFCHVSMPISPTNPHYGVHGDYPFASHVETKSNLVYGALDSPLKTYYDIMFKLKLVNYQFQRLTFNPDFDFMSAQIRKFVSTI